MPVPYVLIRSGRRTLALTVGPAGELTVRAPQRMPLRDIERFMAEKRRWIEEKQRLAREKAEQASPLALGPGQELPFGNGALVLCPARVPFAFAYHGFLLTPGHRPLLPALRAFVLEQAEKWLPQRVGQWQQQTGVRVNSLHFSTARTRWGSMSGKGDLRLNMALMLCPTPIADYVIVHELAHIRHLNHSPAFWKQVEAWMPDYRGRRGWLKQNSALIRLLQPDAKA